MPELYLTMPQPGETITEGTIVAWLVKPGETIEEGHIVAELETEKAIFEYESPFAGKVVRLLYENGAHVKVAEPMAIMDVSQDKAELYIMMGVGRRVKEETKIEVGAQPSMDEIQRQSQSKEKTQMIDDEKSKIKMSPLVRRLVKEHGLSEADLSLLTNQNEDGILTKEVVEGWLLSHGDKRQPQEEGRFGSSSEYDVRLCSAIRTRIADNMVLSKSKIPHAHTSISVDVTNLVHWREENKTAFEKEHGTHLNLLSLLTPALIQAIQKYPVVNSSYVTTPDKHEIHVFKKIHLGVACGTDYGLVIPVVHDIGRLKLEEFNKILNDKVEQAQKKKLTPGDMQGATFIFNNYGYFGTKGGVQVILFPLAATLGMSLIEKRVVVKRDQMVIRQICDFSLAFDHRVIDGREAGLFLSEFKKKVESEGPVSLS